VTWRTSQPLLVRTSAVIRLSGPEGGGELTAGGHLVAPRTVQVACAVPGVVRRLYVQLGEHVRSGQILAELDNAPLLEQRHQAAAEVLAARAELRELESGPLPVELDQSVAAVAAVRANLAAAEATLGRMRALSVEGLVARRELEEAERAYEVALAQVRGAAGAHQLLLRGPRAERIEKARARLTGARAALRSLEAQVDQTRVRAPMDGTVIEIKAAPGELVSAGWGSGGAILTVADLDVLDVQLDVEQGHLRRLALGTKGVIQVEADPGRRFRGRLVEVGPVVSRQKLSVSVKVRLDDRDPLLRPGMTARVVLGGQGERGPGVLVVPQAAIDESVGPPRLFRIRHARASPTAVRVVRSHPPDLVVVEGVEEGERVILLDGRRLQGGERVREAATP
jgi:multidrug efflux pump subunit AcrA (membrane-fusion protein)